MMNFWKQRNPNNITEKPPHYRSKSDGGAVLLYLDFLTVLEGEADIVSAVSRSTPTQSQRNRIFFETVKWILSALPFFFLSQIVKFSKLYSKRALKIHIGVRNFPNKIWKSGCQTPFLECYRYRRLFEKVKISQIFIRPRLKIPL